MRHRAGVGRVQDGGAAGRLARPAGYRVSGPDPDGAKDPLAGRVRGSTTRAGHRVRDVGLPVPLLPQLRAGHLPALDSAYIATGKVRWAFVNFPLDEHPRRTRWRPPRWPSAPREQNAFWRVHDLLYQHQDDLGAAQGAGARSS